MPDPTAAAPARLEDLCLDAPRGDDRAWDVLADPEGNECCVFAP